MSTQRIVVLGGSFNPPTIAHFRLMQAALDALDATLGYFVPSSHGYVRRKMKRTPTPNDVLPDQLRLDMLDAMCKDDPRMLVSDVEILSDKGSGHTYETLKLIAAQHPGAEVYFIFGADKLKILPKWSTYDAVTGEFLLLIFSRDGFDPEKLFAKNPQLAARRDRFIFLPQPEGSEDVSSTAIRDILHQGGDPSALMHPGSARVLLSHIAREG